MPWKEETEKARKRRYLVERGGDPERIARHHAQGKLTVRERIAALADPDSFHEVGGLAGNDTYEGENLVAASPIGSVMGWCNLNGRKVFVNGNDSTVRLDLPRGGHGESVPIRRSGLPEITSLQWRIPYVRLLDGPGASVRHYETTGRPEFVSLNQWIEASSRIMAAIPVVSVVMGSAAGIYAIEACLCHFNVIVKRSGHVFPGGPPVVKAALGYEIGKEELGGWEISAYSGIVDRVAEDEKEAFAIVRDFLSYMPDSVWDMPPRAESGDTPDRRDEELMSVIPEEKGSPYNAHEILKHVFDRDSLFELSPSYGVSRITALARANGYPVGVIACNRASQNNGALDVAAAEKVNRFVSLCETFHLPIVTFVDEPGHVTGQESEKQGIVRASARLVQTIYRTRVPWVSFVVGDARGVAGSLAFRPGSGNKRYAWPSATWYTTKSEPRVMPLNRMVDGFGMQDIVDPRDTRPLLCEFVGAAQKIIWGQLGPAQGPVYRP